MEENTYSSFYGDESIDLNNLQESAITKVNFDSVEEFYHCKKCFKLPQITFTDNGKIKLKCKCQNLEDEEISTNKIIERIIGADKDNKKRFNCYCTLHEEKFFYFCVNCEENKCNSCSIKCDNNQHQLVNLHSNVMNIKNKVKEIKDILEKIKNDKGYQFFMNDYVNYDDITFDLSDNQSNIINNETSLISMPNDEQSNDYPLLHFFEIVINNYENYPNGWHFINIRNCYDFFIKKFSKKKIVLNYKNDKSGKIKLFGQDFVNNNKENCLLIIGDKSNNEISLCEYYDINKEENSDFIIVILKEKENKSITNMSYMFQGCQNLINILSDNTIWKTNHVNNMSHMFDSCSSLENLPEFFSTWDTSEVTDMSYLFCQCSSLKHIHSLSNWNLKNINNMNCIFYGCISLEFIPIMDLTNIKNKQKITHNDLCEKIHNIADYITVFLAAIKDDERTFIKNFEAILGEYKNNLYNKNSPGYIHANDALICALNVNDCEDLDKNFQFLLNSVIKEERNFYYIWYLLNKLIKENKYDFLTKKKLINIVSKTEF